MRELLAKIEQKRIAAKAFTEGETKDLDKAKGLLDEIDELTKEFEIEKRLFESEKAHNAPTDDQIQDKEKDSTVDGFAVVAKMLKNQKLDDTEKALIVGGTSGEEYLLPEDVQLAIKELRRSYISAKDLVTVNPVNALTGSSNYESGDVVGLTALTDGNDIDATGQPAFTRKPWAIDFFAKIIPVSNILQGAEKAGLLGYLNRWFIKNAVYTENNAIFTALKSGKVAKAIKGWEALKLSINTELDPAILLDAVIVTNQTGFSILDAEKFADGKPVLQENPANRTEKLFQGLPVRVFSDAQLPLVGGLAPMFYGSLKAGAEFEDYQNLQFATSEHFYFGKNQTAIRVIEGFDVIQTDADAYIYATFEATPVVTG
ncbi:phage major capsid protein [Proteiniclasticum sp. BAD-10]|uniref:Phage major capsid protein n=1 Tax=Proteiniclasticum sediminis TaxID=2804028 RepID=A0A941CP80_9CLOT|nr:phage major capsid protein [Proteiniclasticum sediminis]MBR0575687.1 phage major capsid protein [Proteiniclasticum sediminis]